MSNNRVSTAWLTGLRFTLAFLVLPVTEIRRFLVIDLVAVDGVAVKDRRPSVVALGAP